MRVSEKNFVKRLKRQDEAALEYVIDTYMPLIKAIVYKILHPLGKVDLVEECVSDVFLSVWQNTMQFKGDAIEFKKWIGMIAKYKAIDQYRVLERRQAREQVLDGTANLTSRNLIQDQVLQREERNELLFELSKLEPVDRDIFTMKYFLEMANGEIADALFISKAAVDNRLYRGKRKLAYSLTKSLEERWT
ncbi:MULTISPECIES: sigma-70 family RNA polymerase sigma factor [unclassified Viridibacillus]|uniref:sigma-70 family RNA polymerase sigma factor n=1 Tax=unclassified Viridibacillus TaxID=2617942 RepID=UPI00096C6E72|nr:sigma-70 family RNA polymerase sigma factor [Viridibacillus sp. FSL H8-0123]OMC82004.1 RNA polymerase subunit sigma-70 [Viridibacillus sp. FSL H8-0123]